MITGRSAPRSAERKDCVIGLSSRGVGLLSRDGEASGRGRGSTGPGAVQGGDPDRVERTAVGTGGVVDVDAPVAGMSGEGPARRIGLAKAARQDERPGKGGGAATPAPPPARGGRCCRPPRPGSPCRRGTGPPRRGAYAERKGRSTHAPSSTCTALTSTASGIALRRAATRRRLVGVELDPAHPGGAGGSGDLFGVVQEGDEHRLGPARRADGVGHGREPGAGQVMGPVLHPVPEADEIGPWCHGGGLSGEVAPHTWSSGRGVPAGELIRPAPGSRRRGCTGCRWCRSTGCPRPRRVPPSPVRPR